MRNRRTGILAIFLAAAAAFSGMAEGGKFERLPPLLAVSVRSQDRVIGNKEQYVYKEYLETSNRDVNREIQEIVDSLDERYSPFLRNDERRNARRNSRLDIEINYSRTGESWLSMLILARRTWQRQQEACHIETRTYDLESGKRVWLSDIFAEESPAWGMIAERVREKLDTVFPTLERDFTAIRRLCEPDALRVADFTLGAAELTLHYEASILFPEKTGLIHVRFFYPEFAGIMTEEAARQTDNSRYKMVAITCDDGPRHDIDSPN